MPYFKDKQNGLHFLSEEDLAQGGKAMLEDHAGKCTAISDAAAAAILAAAEPPPTIVMVNAEAQRRIFLIAPDWKQRNLTARAVILTRKVADGSTLTTEEQAEWDAGEAIWDAIKAVRDASNVLNALPSIPRDFAADTHWP